MMDVGASLFAGQYAATGERAASEEASLHACESR